MKDRFVVDTCALISYFHEVFGGDISVSKESLEIIDMAFTNNSHILIFPAAVFIEIADKWYRNEEKAERIRYEIYERIKSSENMAILPLDKEILENYLLIKDIEHDHNFDSHDKQIYASAMALQCPLISSDLRLIRYNKRKKLIPEILN